jgi:hypothetical protein
MIDRNSCSRGTQPFEIRYLSVVVTGTVPTYRTVPGVGHIMPYIGVHLFTCFYSGVPDPYHFIADPDPAFHINADPDTSFHFNADPDPAPH